MLDGKTTGPKTSEGLVGKLITAKDLTDKEIVNFKPFKGLGAKLPTLEEAKHWNLRCDQKYALTWAWVMIEGPAAVQRNPSLAVLSPGKPTHSRWLTKANRCMRAFASATDKDDIECLSRLVKFILTSYLLSWFQIKRHEMFLDAPFNFLFCVKTLKDFKPTRAEKNVLESVFNWNSYRDESFNYLVAL